MRSGNSDSAVAQAGANPAPPATEGAAARNSSQTAVPLAKAGQTQAAAQRKVIKNADVSLQTSDPDGGGRRITAAAEAKGGFVVSAESSQAGVSRNVRVTARVPSDKFEEFLAEVRQAGARVISEKQTSQDVTEEFIDVEARLRVQKETETRYLEFLKQAKGVDDALSVQEHLSNVRTEIERLEGRKRFLESQTSLSTVNVTLVADAVINTTPTGFWHDVKTSFSEGFTAATGIILFLIRAIVTLLPVFLLILLPLGLVLRYLIRLYGKRAKAMANPDVAAPAEKV
jgi:hypothetical protein